MKDVITDLCERMDTLRTRYAVVHRAEFLAAPPYIPMAEALAQALASGEPAPSAVTIARTLIDPCEMDRAIFWGTPLGQLMFLAGCYGRETCTQTVAASVLSMTRQGVSWMVKEGKLPAAEYPGVYVEDVRKVLVKRLARLALDGDVKQV